MVSFELTDRQQREQAYYQEFSKKAQTEINFGPVGTSERRPWNAHWAVYETVLARFASPEQRVLDFGCGPGYSSVIHARIGYEVFGFDICPSNVAHAERLARAYGVAHRTHFAVKAAERLDYPPEYFDVIVGLDILHHVDIPKAISQCVRLLKPGGVALFAEPLQVPLFDAVRNTRLARRFFPNDMSFDRHITADERKLTATDLQVVRTHCPRTSLRRFLLFSRLDRFVRRSNNNEPSILERLDYHLFKVLPPLEKLGGYGVLTLARA